jgi:cytochrome c biogenesis protein CcmG/thiol:disulfide interchange protein DsbE
MDAEMRNERPETNSTQRSRLLTRFRFARWLIAAALVVLLGALLFSRIHHANQVITHVQQITASSVRAGQVAPDFSFTPISGASAQAVSLSKLRGHVVVINFWSPACAPCQDEAPILAQTARSFAPRGVVFLGVAFDGSRDDILNFIHRYNIPYVCGKDDTNTTAVTYGLVAIPVTIVVDRSGTVARSIQGSVTQEDLDQTLQHLLGSEHMTSYNLSSPTG